MYTRCQRTHFFQAEEASVFLVVFLVLLEWQWFGRLNIFSDFLAGSGEISMAMDSPRNCLFIPMAMKLPELGSEF